MEPLVIIGVALLAGLLLLAGYWWRSRETIIERSQLAARRRALDIEWSSLRQGQQLSHLAYWGQETMRHVESQKRNH